MAGPPEDSALVRSHHPASTGPGQIRIGTSGWSYPHWKGRFYPNGLRSSQFLAYYAQRLSTVEINSTFYRLPDRTVLERWRNTVPDPFIFSVKASRYITHMKKLERPARSLAALFDRLGILGRALGPVRFQLPPGWTFNKPRLASFLETLGGACLAVFEFRDPSWFREETYELLKQHRAACCIYDLSRRQSPRIVTTDFVYVRLHGPDGAYRGQYDNRALQEWANACLTWMAQGRTVYCYFDNDERGYAAQDALRLQRIIDGVAAGG